MNKFIYILMAFMSFLSLPSELFATNSTVDTTAISIEERTLAESTTTTDNDELDVKTFIMDHLADSYEWHIMNWGEKHITIPLPIIVYSKTTGWHVFSSSKFHKHTVYYGLTIATEGKYEGKIVEVVPDEPYRRPFDISITKVVAAMLFNSILLVLIILGVAHSYKKSGIAPKAGFVGIMEMFIMSIVDDVIKPSIGHDYKRFVPFLLTIFFYIFLTNLMGLVPLFPGGANVTGNIAITFVLAIFVFIMVNVSGTREYWKEILWPDVPIFLKFPIPLLPIIELMGIFTKPFALMVRLFANIMAGHAIILGLTSLIFITVKMGVAINTQMTVLSVFFSVFMGLLEIMVAFVQAYVFTLLSAVFIGMARIHPHYEDAKKDLD